MSLWERIQILIDSKGITAYELSRAIGISQSTITKWKKGIDVKPRKEILEKLAEYFNVTEDWLRTGQEMKQNATKNQVSNELNRLSIYDESMKAINSLISQNNDYIQLILKNTELIQENTEFLKELRKTLLN